MIKKLYVFLLLSLTLMFATKSHAIPIVDTGTPNGSSHFVLFNDQWLAGEFSLSASTTITDISGYMTDNAGGSLTLAIYGDGGTIPNVGNELFSQQFSVAPTGGGPFSDDWYGLSGLSLNLMSGEYWVAFEVRPTDSYSGSMLNSAPSPLSNYAFNSAGGSYSSFSSLTTGLRINGTPSPVPEPSTMLLLSSGLIGLVVFNYRRKNQTA